MEALILTGRGICEMRRVPVPAPQGDEVLCRVRSVAICGSNQKIIKGVTAGAWPPALHTDSLLRIAQFDRAATHRSDGP